MTHQLCILLASVMLTACGPTAEEQRAVEIEKELIDLKSEIANVRYNTPKPDIESLQKRMTAVAEERESKSFKFVAKEFSYVLNGRKYYDDYDFIDSEGRTVQQIDFELEKIRAERHH